MGHDLVRFISNDLENGDFSDEMLWQLAFSKWENTRKFLKGNKISTFPPSQRSLVAYI